MLTEARKTVAVIIKAASSQFENGFRFAQIGVLSACVHFLVLWVALSYTKLAPLLANFVAYSIAFLVSFFGHFKWTFQSKEPKLRAFIKFVLISFTAFLLNSGVLLILLITAWFVPFLAAFMAFLFSSVFIFLASRYWAFR